MVDLNQKDRVVRIKIVYYGPALGGKTTNLRVLHQHAIGARRGEFISVNSMQDRTILCDLLPLRSGGFRGFDLKLQLLAVPGQAMYSATRRVVLKAADAVVFVANSASDRWYENTQSLKEMNANLIASQLDPNTIPLVIQFNKRDLPQVIALDALSRELNVRHVPTFPAVARSGTGVLETFSAILSQTVQDLGRRYRTMELPAGQSLDAWTKEAVKGMFGRERLEVPTVEVVGEQVYEPPIQIERSDGTLIPIAGGDQRRIRIATPEDAPRAPATTAPAPPPAIVTAEALASSYAEASTELGFAVNDLREERDAALARLDEMRRALDLATASPGAGDVESRVRKILQVLVDAGSASGATLRLATGDARHIVPLLPLVSDPLSRTPWGQTHLDGLRDIPEPLVEEAFESAGLTDALRAGEPSFEAVVLVPLRSAERLLGLGLLYYDRNAALPSRETLVHLGFLARELASPLEASAAREATAATGRLRVLTHASAAAVASLLARLPADTRRQKRLGLAAVLAPLRVPGVTVEVEGEPEVLSDAPILRFALASLVHLCEVDALDRSQSPEIAIRVASSGARVDVTVSARGGAAVLSSTDKGSDVSDAVLSVVQSVVELHGGTLTASRSADQLPVFTVQLLRA